MQIHICPNLIKRKKWVNWGKIGVNFLENRSKVEHGHKCRHSKNLRNKPKIEDRKRSCLTQIGVRNAQVVGSSPTGSFKISLF